MPLKNGKEDTSAYDSLENGVIFLYNSIKSKVNADLDLLLEDSDIDSILNGSTGDFNDSGCAACGKAAQSFVDDLVGQAQGAHDRPGVGKTVFVGGG
jgi:plasmid segregation protein ParM